MINVILVGMMNLKQLALLSKEKNMRKQNESYLRTTTTKNRFELSM